LKVEKVMKKVKREYRAVLGKKFTDIKIGYTAFED